MIYFLCTQYILKNFKPICGYFMCIHRICLARKFGRHPSVIPIHPTPWILSLLSPKWLPPCKAPNPATRCCPCPTDDGLTLLQSSTSNRACVPYSNPYANRRARSHCIVSAGEVLPPVSKAVPAPLTSDAMAPGRATHSRVTSPLIRRTHALLKILPASMFAEQ